MISGTAVEAGYDGPQLDEWPPTLAFVAAAAEHMRAQKRLPRVYVLRILLGIRDLLKTEKTVNYVDRGDEESLTVCGDVHGQYYDLLQLYALNGAPSEEKALDRADASGSAGARRSPAPPPPAQSSRSPRSGVRMNTSTRWGVHIGTYVLKAFEDRAGNNILYHSSCRRFVARAPPPPPEVALSNRKLSRSSSVAQRGLLQNQRSQHFKHGCLLRVSESILQPPN